MGKSSPEKPGAGAGGEGDRGIGSWGPPLAGGGQCAFQAEGSVFLVWQPNTNIQQEIGGISGSLFFLRVVRPQFRVQRICWPRGQSSARFGAGDGASPPPTKAQGLPVCLKILKGHRGTLPIILSLIRSFCRDVLQRPAR